MILHFIRDYFSHKAGDIVDANEKLAKAALKAGVAYADPEKKPTTKKVVKP